MARGGYFAVGSLANVHVLIVDADPDSLLELTEILAYCGALVASAASEAEALRMLEHVRPDAVIVARPPGGGRLVGLIRSRKPEDSGVVPIVAIEQAGDTADASEGYTTRLRRPLNPWELCRLVSTLLSTSSP